MSSQQGFGFPKVEIGGGTGKPTVVFLAGFPDDQESSWGPILRSKMAEQYHVLFLCLPGFERGGVPKRWGYTFDELLDIMHFTIQQATRKDEKIFLVGHDWGSYVAHKYQNKFSDKVKKLVLIDVGMIKLHTASLEQIAFIAMYQSWFAISFVISQLISRTLGHLMLYLFALPWFAPLFTGLWEGSEVGDRMQRDDKVVLRCYPYFQIWKLLLTNTIVYPHFPTCPLLYLVRKLFSLLFTII